MYDNKQKGKTQNQANHDRIRIHVQTLMINFKGIGFGLLQPGIDGPLARRPQNYRIMESKQDEPRTLSIRII
jgi:hypothetical protein